MRAKETEKTHFFDLSCCTGPDRCQAGCSPKLEGTAKKNGFFVSGGQGFCFHFFLGSFDKSLSRRFDGGAEEPRTAHQKIALRDSRCRQHLMSGAESSCRDLRLRVEAGLVKVLDASILLATLAALLFNVMVLARP